MAGNGQAQATRRPKRPSGGQPGNWNAFKHGFYSRRFRPLELSDLDAILSEGLTDEIALLRVIIRRVFEFADQDAADLGTWAMSLNTLGSAATRLAGLLRTQHIIYGGCGDIVSVLSEAIGEVAHELGFRDPTRD